MASKLIFGEVTGNLYRSFEDRVKDFERLYVDNPVYYSQWFITCIKDVVRNGRIEFKKGITYRVHDKVPDAYQVASGNNLEWIDLNELNNCFVPAGMAKQNK